VAQVQGVAAAGDVDVLAPLVEAVVGPVVEAAPRQAAARLALLGGVVVDDVEDHLEALGVQLPDHRLELVEDALRVRGGGIPGVRREEAERVVAPVVDQPPSHHLRLRGEGLHGQQLDGGDAQLLEVAGHRRVAQAGIRAPQLRGHAGMGHGEAAHVRLVGDRVGEQVLGALVVPPVEVTVDDDTTRQVCRAVTPADQRVVPGQGGVDAVGEDLGLPVDLALDGLGVRVEQQLLGVVAQPLGGPPRAAGPDGIPLAGANTLEKAEPHAVGAVGQGDAALGGAGAVTRLEQAELDGVRVPGIHGELGAPVDQGHPVRRRQVAPSPSGGNRMGRRRHGPQPRQWLPLHP
jgi:hypothetical protein